MGEITLITGGARSGKSGKGEELLAQYEKVVYIATALPLDPEMEDRISKHQKNRPPSWFTLEAYDKIEEKIPKGIKEGILLDCLTIMVCNLMLKEEPDWENIPMSRVEEIEEVITQKISRLLRHLEKMPCPVIIITNELGMGLVPAYPLGRHFRDIAGRINKITATAASRVIFMVSGIPMTIKGRDN